MTVAASPWLRTFGLSCLLAMPCVVGNAQSPDDANRTVIRVLDENEQPIAAAKCSVRAANKSGYTDAEITRKGDGAFELPIAEDLQFLQITVRADGRTPMVSSWSAGDLKKNGPPDEIVFPLKKGAVISGRVKDEKGQAIANATVRLLAITPAKRGTVPYPSVYDHPVTTDATGKWSCNILPDDMSDVWLRYEHDEFISDSHFGMTTSGVSVDQLREGTLVAVLKKGKTVVGFVVDPEGNPIENAMVYQGSDRFGSSYPQTKTDAKGTFRFPNSRNGEMILTIYAPGFAPELLTLDVAPNSRAARVKLQRGKRLLLRVVDADGKPLDDVLVAPDTWRKHRSLCDLKIPRRTNENGEYVWNDAPEDAIEFSVLKRGFMDIRDREFTATDQLQVVTMIRPLKVTGKITDAVTGAPIKSFSVVPGIQWDARQPSWQPSNSKKFSDGRFEIGFSFPRPGYILRIDAVGYRSATSRAFTADEPDVVIDLQLQPDVPMTGIVKDSEGNPVEGAHVMINSSGNHVAITNGRMADNRDVTYATTSKDGRFELPSRGAEAWIAAVHPAGIKLVACKEYEGGDITLTPWSSIDGMATIDDAPAEGMIVSLGVSTEAPFYFTGRASVDEKGGFRFQRVPPNQTINITLGESNQVVIRETVETKPGKTSAVTLKD